MPAERPARGHLLKSPRRSPTPIGPISKHIRFGLFLFAFTITPILPLIVLLLVQVPFPSYILICSLCLSVPFDIVDACRCFCSSLRPSYHLFTPYLQVRRRLLLHLRSAAHSPATPTTLARAPSCTRRSTFCSFCQLTEPVSLEDLDDGGLAVSLLHPHGDGVLRRHPILETGLSNPAVPTWPAPQRSCLQRYHAARAL